jgi:zinc transport system substrate-binding protein/iron/zinc/copper transport system substrate-binding protein
MKSLVKIIFLFLILSSQINLCFSGTVKYEYAATTKWVASIAEIAGVENIVTFAPSTLTHPPEYELKPDDIKKLSLVKVVFYAGYEKKMVEKINESMNKNKFKVIQVKTENSFQCIKDEAYKIAKELNTLDKYEKNIKELDSLFNKIKNDLKSKGLYGKTVFVHNFQVPFIKDLGFNIIGTFGPAPVNADKIKEVSALKPDIIVDNYHNQVAKPLVEVNNKSKYISLINFPGLFETKSLFDVIQYNGTLLLK